MPGVSDINREFIHTIPLIPAKEGKPRIILK